MCNCLEFLDKHLVKLIMIAVLLMVLFSTTGCVEVAWNSSGHFATQAPELDTAKVKWSYADPLPHDEVVNERRLPPEMTETVHAEEAPEVHAKSKGWFSWGRWFGKKGSK